MSRQQEVACMLCFRDGRLRNRIREDNNRSHCPWCGAKNTYIISLLDLGPIFRNVVCSIYEPVDDRGSSLMGDDISFLLQEDWKIFSDRIEEAPTGVRQKLTISILEAGLDPKNNVDEPDYRGGFRRTIDWLETSWDKRIENLITKNCPNIVGVPSSRDRQFHLALEELSVIYEINSILYRARIHKDRTRVERFKLHELGAHPTNKARSSRANREGQVVLYLANDEATAIAEVRSWKGIAVAIAKVRTLRKLWLVDLRCYSFPESPFFEEHLNWRIQLAGLFHRFSDELSRPVMPHEEEILYQPSQHLCDLVKKAGFDGIIFKSAMGTGFNIVVFDPLAAEVFKVKYFRVNEVYHRYQEMKEKESIYFETPYDYLLSNKKANTK